MEFWGHFFGGLCCGCSCGGSGGEVWIRLYFIFLVRCRRWVGGVVVL